MFWLKKVATLLLMPLFAAWLSSGRACFCHGHAALRRCTGLIVAAGALPLTILSFQPVANEFIKPLEMCCTPLVDFQAIRGAKWVVVLGEGTLRTLTGRPISRLAALPWPDWSKA